MNELEELEKVVDEIKGTWPGISFAGAWEFIDGVYPDRWTVDDLILVFDFGQYVTDRRVRG